MVEKFIEYKIWCPHCKHSWFYGICTNFTKYVEEVLNIECKHCKKNFEIARNTYKIYLSRSLQTADTKYKYVNSVISKYEGLFLFVDPLKLGDNISLRLRELRGCDICVSCIQGSSTAPFFEIMYARMLGIPCFVIDLGTQFTMDKWVHGCADQIFTSVEKCYENITKQLSACGKKTIVFANQGAKLAQVVNSLVEKKLYNKND